MSILHRKQIAEEPTLVLPSPDGEPWAAFPMRVVDPIRRLIFRLERKDALPERLSIVAALRGEGVSYIASAFATILAADIETTVCLVDLNWWWPSQLSHQLAETGCSLSSLLKGETSIESAVLKTGIRNLGILPAGHLPPEARAHYASSFLLKDVIQSLSTRYDHLILDIPAVLASSDAIPLASLGTASCLVVQQAVTSVDEVKAAMSDLEHVPNIGVIMNKVRYATPAFIRKMVKAV